MHFLRLLLIGLIGFLPLQMQAAIVLSEIMFDPEGEEASDEFLELYNDAALPVQLTGWTISDGEGTDTLISAGQGLIVAPRQYVLVLDSDYIADGSVTYDGLVPEDALIVTISTNTFCSRGFSNSSSETITLRNSTGTLISEYSYTTGNESGHSDEKIRLGGDNDSTNWQNSESTHGTPGFRNSVTPPDRDIAILGMRSEPDFPAVGTQYRLELLIMNLGLQALSSDIILQADSTGSGDYYFEQAYEIPTISAGDSTTTTDTLRMPLTGIQRLRAKLEIVDDDTTNNSLTVVVSSEVSETGLRVNEIQYTPLTGRAEWVEVGIVGTTPLSTRGMEFSDGQGVADTTKRVQMPDWVLLPEELAIIAFDSTVILENIPLDAKVAVFSSSDITLNNNGDSLIIFAPDNDIVDRVDYRPNWGDDEEGISLERVSISSSSNDHANWGSCVVPNGSTPGSVNSRSISNSNRPTTLSVSPSPFTPNGDGIDEVTEIRFTTENLNGTSALKIFDVRGRLVRRLNSVQQGNTGSVLWDGHRDNGEMATTARYIVLLESASSSGEVIHERTTVILARPR